MATSASPKLRKRFERWAVKNGGVVLPRAQDEFVRFAAGGDLCIIYVKKGAIGAMRGDETAEHWAAFEAGRSADLRPDEPGRGRAEFAGRRAVALAVSDIRNGRSEPLSVRALCRSTGLTVRTVALIARANGGRLCGMKLARSRAFTPNRSSTP